MAINSISGSTLPLQRPATPNNAPRPEDKPARENQEPRVARPEPNEPAANIVQRDIPRLDAATQRRENLGSELQRPKPFESQTNENRERAELLSRERDVTEQDVVVERADQARDALKARFEENSRPKPEPRFEARV